MAASRLALPPADTRLDLVQLPFASLSYLFEYAVKAIAIHHEQGHREYGILCDAFKLNGAWCYAVGPCDSERRVQAKYRITNSNDLDVSVICYADEPAPWGNVGYLATSFCRGGLGPVLIELVEDHYGEC